MKHSKMNRRTFLGAAAGGLMIASSRTGPAQVRPGAVVETTAGKRDGKSLEPRTGRIRRVVQNRRRVDPTAQPDAQGHVGHQMFANRLLEKRVELFLRGLQRALS